MGSGTATTSLSFLPQNEPPPNPDAYLGSSSIIDLDHPSIQELAQKLSTSVSKKGDMSPHDIIKNCFEYVRDEIKHSWDYSNENPTVTCKASDVLKHRTGYCYSKSHLLAALLRANNIPTGLCYQRLTIADDDDGPPYCLHGLNAVYINTKEYTGWYRIDPRGLKPTIQYADFTPPIEALAFPIRPEIGELDIPEIYVEPIPLVVKSLMEAKTWKDVADNLPDIEA